MRPDYMPVMIMCVRMLLIPLGMTLTSLVGLAGTPS